MTESYLITVPKTFDADYAGCPILPCHLELLPTGQVRWDYYDGELGEGSLEDFEELHDVAIGDLIVALREDHKGEDADALALFARGPVRVFALERGGDFTLRAEGEYLPGGTTIVGAAVVTSLGVHVEWGEATRGLCRGLDYRHLVDRGLGWAIFGAPCRACGGTGRGPGFQPANSKGVRGRNFCEFCYGRGTLGRSGHEWSSERRLEEPCEPTPTPMSINLRRVMIAGCVRHTDVAPLNLDWRRGEGELADSRTGTWAWLSVQSSRGSGWIDIQFRPAHGDRYLALDEHAC